MMPEGILFRAPGLTTKPYGAKLATAGCNVEMVTGIHNIICFPMEETLILLWVIAGFPVKACLETAQSLSPAVTGGGLWLGGLGPGRARSLISITNFGTYHSP